MKCQSVAEPSSALYWHIGAMMMRLASRSSPIWKGSKSRLIGRRYQALGPGVRAQEVDDRPAGVELAAQRAAEQGGAGVGLAVGPEVAVADHLEVLQRAAGGTAGVVVAHDLGAVGDARARR